jgi:hypothetical protein
LKKKKKMVVAGGQVLIHLEVPIFYTLADYLLQVLAALLAFPIDMV